MLLQRRALSPQLFKDPDCGSGRVLNLRPPAQQTGAYPIELTGSGKLRSGREAKPTSSVLYPQLWLQSFICLTRTQLEVHYEDRTCTIAELVAGYAQILQSKDIISLGVSERQKHLVSLICLMYFAQQFTWSAFLDKFHDAVLLEIERALIQWGDSFMHLERRTLYGHPVPETLTAKSSSFKSSPLPILFCRDYQPDAIPVFDLRNHRGALIFRLSSKHISLVIINLVGLRVRCLSASFSTETRFQPAACYCRFKLALWPFR